MTKEIELTQGKVAIVDDEDYEELNKYKWHARKKKSVYYAQRSKRVDGKCFDLYMHRHILGLSYGDGKVTDHINHNGLDNRRSNLRIVDYTISNRNHGIRKNCTSGYSGVHWNKQCKKWRAEIKVNGNRIHLGNYSDILKAKEARLQGEIKYWGSDA